MTDLLSVDDLLSCTTYFNSLQCSNSPDYVEPTEEPCVCPPGAPGLPGIKVSLWKKKKYVLSFFFHFVCFNHWQYKYGQHNSIISKSYLSPLLSHRVECIPTMHLAIFKMAGICDLGDLLLICAKWKTCTTSIKHFPKAVFVFSR